VGQVSYAAVGAAMAVAVAKEAAERNGNTRQYQRSSSNSVQTAIDVHVKLNPSTDADFTSERWQ
jgi:hypothetical protein